MTHLRRRLRTNIATILSVIKIVLWCILLMLVLNIQVNSAKQAASTAQAAKQIKALSEDNKRLAQQNKHLAEQNAALSKQNQQYLDCNFLAFAHYTQTHKPIQDSEINSCNVAPATQTSAVAAPQSSSKPKQSTAIFQQPKSHQTSSTQATQPVQSSNGGSEATNVPSLLERIAQNVVSLPQHIIDAMGGLL